MFPPSWPKSLLRAALYSSYMNNLMSTPFLWPEETDVGGEKVQQLMELAPCTFAACDHSQLAVTSCREHVTKVAKLWDNFKHFVSNLKI